MVVLDVYDTMQWGSILLNYVWLITHRKFNPSSSCTVVKVIVHSLLISRCHHDQRTTAQSEAVHKNNCVSGRAAGWLKKVRLGTFFFIFAKKLFFFFFSKNGQYFPTNKKKSGKKTKNCGRPTGFNFSHPLDRKQTFFYGHPEQE